MRTGGDEGVRRLEHPSSLRLLGLEHGPLDSSTPQGEDLPSPLSSHNSPSMVLKRDLSLHCSLHVWTIFFTHIFTLIFIWNPLQQDDYHNVPTQPVLERLSFDQPSKHSSLSLDLNANEDVSEQSGSESVEDCKKTRALGRR